VAIGALGFVVAVAAVVERWRYRRLGGARLGPDWTKTAERVVDPETGELVTGRPQPVRHRL
jgi:hypothetical protein